MAHIVTPIGTCAWVNLIEPVENLSKQREWNLGLQLSELDSGVLLEACQAAVNKQQESEPNFPDISKCRMPYKPAKKKLESGDLEELPGFMVWQMKRKYVRMINKEEKNNTPPVIYDANGRIITSDAPRIASGSTGKAVLRAMAYTFSGRSGVTLILEGFQINELKAGETPELPPIEGGWVPEGQEETIDVSSLLNA